MRKWTGFVLVAGLALTAVSAGVARDFSISASTGYQVEYVFRGLQFGYSGQSSSLGLNYQISPEFSAGVSGWHWQPYASGYGSEYDVTARLTYASKSLPVTVTGGYIHYGGPLGNITKNELFASVSTSVSPWNPTLSIYHGLTNQHHDVFLASAGRAWTLPAKLTYVTWGAVGFNSGKTYAPNGFAVAILGQSLTYPLGNGLSVTGTFDIDIPSHNYNRSVRLVPGVKLAWEHSF
ncbi:MAG: hypothetical protein HZB16_21225 [Armatimonadetes bacterium]|nr:hypothetical protein [Armatimonadota bacterium]